MRTTPLIESRLQKVLGISLLMFLCLSSLIDAQELPPRPVVINVTAQTLSFGAFTHGVVGGTVTISSSGTRSSSGDVILLSLGYSYSTTRYEVIANPGTIISILNGPNVSLPGSNGGSILLTVGASDPVSPFVTSTPPPLPTYLDIGGTITIGNTAANPPGSYSGTYDITFVQQ
ncbi:MAG: DUF4402 domain-containing protein [Bacteroides sp.]|nr:DUF4402 domain-containing protein [Bacteroides sp.]